MKKNLLFAAAMLVSVAASAQTVVWTLHGPAENLSATVSGSETINASGVINGLGIKVPSTVQLTVKDTQGTAFSYPEDGSGIIKWVPDVVNDPTTVPTPKTIEDAVANNQYIDFQVTEMDDKKYLEFGNLKFNAWRYGTDAVRINVKLFAVGDDGQYDSDWLIDEAVAATFGDEYTSWIVDDGAEGTIPGYMPSREDGSKATANKTAPHCSHVTIAKPADFPENVFEITARVLIYGIAENKAAGFENVTFNFGTDAIQSVTAEKTNVNAPIYNLAGQQVDKSFKGVCIQNGRKFINK
ncbi:MAG: hypothetical protein ACI4A7_08240 [Prevotella sp.]